MYRFSLSSCALGALVLLQPAAQAQGGRDFSYNDSIAVRSLSPNKVRMGSCKVVADRQLKGVAFLDLVFMQTSLHYDVEFIDRLNQVTNQFTVPFIDQGHFGFVVSSTGPNNSAGLNLAYLDAFAQNDQFTVHCSKDSGASFVPLVLGGVAPFDDLSGFVGGGAANSSHSLVYDLAGNLRVFAFAEDPNVVGIYDRFALIEHKIDKNCQLISSRILTTVSGLSTSFDDDFIHAIVTDTDLVVSFKPGPTFTPSTSSTKFFGVPAIYEENGSGSSQIISVGEARFGSKRNNPHALSGGRLSASNLATNGKDVFLLSRSTDQWLNRASYEVRMFTKSAVTGRYFNHSDPTQNTPFINLAATGGQWTLNRSSILKDDLAASTDLVQLNHFVAPYGTRNLVDLIYLSPNDEAAKTNPAALAAGYSHNKFQRLRKDMSSIAGPDLPIDLCDITETMVRQATAGTWTFETWSSPARTSYVPVPGGCLTARASQFGPLGMILKPMIFFLEID